MAGGEGTREDFKQAVQKGKAKQPTQPGYGAISVSPGSSSLPKSLLLPIAESAPGRSSLREPLLLPIAELAPGQTIINWEIQGLVVCKSDIKPYTKGYGNYFSFEMRDEAGGEIRVVCFQSEVTRFFTKVVEGKEHVLTRGKLMKPKERFNRMNRRCEIVLEYDSEIRVLEEEEENNKSLLERVTEINKDLEFCTSKLQELETEIKKAGKIGNPGAAGTSIVKTEAPGVVGISENRAQSGGEEKKKVEFPVIRKTSSSSNTPRGAGLGTLVRVLPTKLEAVRSSTRP